MQENFYLNRAPIEARNSVIKVEILMSDEWVFISR